MNLPLRLSLFFLSSISLYGQDILPPTRPWNGKSMNLIVKKENPWVTPVEKGDFQTTPNYLETMSWLQRLVKATPLMQMKTIGKSGNQRNINMIVASSSKEFDAATLKKSIKPLLLIQAGIHAGEIDGKDAGVMLMRDIAFGTKKSLLDRVNILFIPILNVDGHERSGPYNRVNQLGPSNMGWRTNGRNLNLNRDYAKMDTEGIRAVVKVINDYQPDLYLDLHVTDGADYQYDITYGFHEKNNYSPKITAWLAKKLVPSVNGALTQNGHIPGPLIQATNDRDLTEGFLAMNFPPRFSHAYGDLRHLPTILVENHSLKPFKQRVLGTYIFLEGVIAVLGTEGATLKQAVTQDKALRPERVTLSFKPSSEKTKYNFLGIESKVIKSTVTQQDVVTWTGKPIKQEISVVHIETPDKVAVRPKSYWVPATYANVIQRLQAHGIVMDILTQAKEVKVTMYRIENAEFSPQPSEGHMLVSGQPVAEEHSETFYPGSARIGLDQPLGDLAAILLEPESPDSFLQWGFFNEIFERTEYIEPYAIDPLARYMLIKDSELKTEFERKLREDVGFARNPTAIYEWFYEQSPYLDSRWKLYPVGVEY